MGEQLFVVDVFCWVIDSRELLNGIMAEGSVQYSLLVIQRVNMIELKLSVNVMKISMFCIAGHSMSDN